MNIGVFDSGLGGLTIFKELLKASPEYNYIYLGDNARLPYGGHSADTVYRFTREALRFLFKKDCQLVIIACNTSTSNALHKIQSEFLPKNYPERKVLGVIKPTIEEISEKNQIKIGVIGTKSTIKSEAFVREIKKVKPYAMIVQQAAPLLVPFIEEGETGSPAFNLMLKKYLKKFQIEKVGSLILACTHYGLIKKQIEKILGPKIYVIDEGRLVAKKLKLYLQKHSEIDKKLEKNGKRQFFITELNPGYEKMMAIFLGSHWRDNKIQLIKIDN